MKIHVKITFGHNSKQTLREIEIEERWVKDVIDEWCDKKRDRERGVRLVLEIEGC